MRFRIKVRKNIFRSVTREVADHVALHQLLADYRAKGYRVTAVGRI